MAVDRGLEEVMYALEQQRQTGGVEALEQRIEVCRQQVEHFAGQVTRLATDYRTLAATLRALELMQRPGRQREPERDSGPSR